jgi:hypothetical protein
MTPGLILNKSEIVREFTPLAAPPISRRTPIPNRIDRRDEMLPASDQRATSECAAYSIAGIIEAKNWRDTGVFTQIDPSPIYAEAKKTDGYAGAGTTLNAVFDAVVKLGLMPKPNEVYAITDRDGFYRALHRYGFVHLAFNITEAWSRPSTSGWLLEDSHLPLIGGHAVAGCGFDRNAKGWNAIQNSWSDTKGWHGFLRMTHAQFDRQFVYGLAWK